MDEQVGDGAAKARSDATIGSCPPFPHSIRIVSDVPAKWGIWQGREADMRETGNGTGSKEQHSFQSVLRERIIEHVFVGEALRRLWQLGVAEVEVLRSEFDAGGYDVVFSYKDVVRHVQLKSAIEGGKTNEVSVSLKLAEKPSGCVLWIIVDDQLDFRGYRWFGGQPGQALPDIGGKRQARQTRANKDGVKADRSGHRILRRGDFERLASLDAVLQRLFGELLPPFGTSAVGAHDDR